MKKTLWLAGVASMTLAVVLSSSVYAGAEEKCKVCHKFTDQNFVGPGLKGVFGRKAGTHPGYKYKFTKYLKGDAWTWDEESLRAWINNSKKAVKKLTGNKKAKTSMPPQHVTGADADAVITFLKGLK